MRNLNLDQIQTLIAIADLGTFAAASQALHLAPPTISLHIKELEARMQVPLVLRGRRQAGLTAAGQALVEKDASCWPPATISWTSCRRAAGSVGVVKVGVSAGVGIRLLPLVLEALARARLAWT